MHRVEYRLKEADIAALRRQGYTGPKVAGDWSVAHAFRSLPQAKVAEHRMRKQGYETRVVKGGL